MGGGLLFLGVGIVAWARVPHAARTVRRRASHARELRSRSTGLRGRHRRTPVVVSYSVESCSADCSGGGMGIFGVVASSVAAQPRTAAEGHAATHRLAFRLLRRGPKRTARRSGRPRRGIDRDRVSEGTENSDRGQAVDQTVLIRVSNEAFTTMKGRETWAPHGYVAYSKVCTHLGCPVGTLRARTATGWCARVTNRCSTSPTGPCRSSVRRRDHCRNCRSTSTPQVLAQPERLPRSGRSGILGA